MFVATREGVLERRPETPRRAHSGETAALFSGSSCRRLCSPRYPVASALLPARNTVRPVTATHPSVHRRDKARGVLGKEVEHKRGAATVILAIGRAELPPRPW